MNIAFYGGHYWDRGPWFRKQHFARRLARRGHHVLYVETSVSIVRRTSGDKNLAWRSQIADTEPGLCVLTPACFPPRPSARISRSVHNARIHRSIRNHFAGIGGGDYALWSNDLSFASTFRSISGRLTVFDLCDDIPEYARLEGNESVARLYDQYVANAFASASVPVVSAVRLKEKYQFRAAREILVIPNGYESSARVRPSAREPEELRQIRRPRVGFIGTLFHFLDENLIERIVAERPGYSFVFVGPAESSYPTDRLTRNSNVHLLGVKPRERLPDYVRAFDVCINPFRRHEVNDSVNPVKVFEYLAERRHVVSTPMYSLMREPVAPYIHFCSTAEEFLSAMDRCVGNPAENNVPRHVLESYSWDNLFTRLTEEVRRVHGVSL